jgi:hypothetical protein
LEKEDAVEMDKKIKREKVCHKLCVPYKVETYFSSFWVKGGGERFTSAGGSKKKEEPIGFFSFSFRDAVQHPHKFLSPSWETRADKHLSFTNDFFCPASLYSSRPPVD